MKQHFFKFNLYLKTYLQVCDRSYLIVKSAINCHDSGDTIFVTKNSSSQKENVNVIREVHDCIRLHDCRRLNDTNIANYPVFRYCRL